VPTFFRILIPQVNPAQQTSFLRHRSSVVTGRHQRGDWMSYLSLRDSRVSCCLQR